MKDVLTEKNTELCEFLATSFDVAQAKVGVAYNAELINVISSDEDVIYIRMVKPSGEIYLSTEKSEMGNFIEDSSIATTETVIKDDVYNGANINTVISASESGYTIWLGFSLESLNTAFYESILMNILVFLPIMGGIIVVSYFLSRNMTEPLKRLMDGVDHIRNGDLNFTVDIQSEDELGELGHAFNQMSVDLKTSKVEIEKYSRDLEGLVTERTKELDGKIKDLEENELATLNIMEDLQETIGALTNAESEIKDKNEELQTNAENLHKINEEVTLTNESLTAAQEELRQLNESLEIRVQDRTAEIEELLKQKDEFIGQLGHDLKTPLTPLVTLLPIIQKRQKDKKSKELLDVSLKNIKYMRDLVVKTLELARLNAPNTKLDIADTDLLKELNKVIDANELIFKEHEIAVENKIDKNVMVQADELRLNELFTNLLTNAVKYTPAGGAIALDAQIKKDDVIVSVKDTGIGMTKEQLNHIFDEFYKVDSSRHDLDSSGLGLPICKRIVEKHGGKIWVESPGEGKGSTFYFTIKKSSLKKKGKKS